MSLLRTIPQNFYTVLARSATAPFGIKGGRRGSGGGIYILKFILYFKQSNTIIAAKFI
jgi:hypothetical protein